MRRGPRYPYTVLHLTWGHVRIYRHKDLGLYESSEALAANHALIAVWAMISAFREGGDVLCNRFKELDGHCFADFRLFGEFGS